MYESLYYHAKKVLALVLAFAYTYSQDNKGKKVSFFVITFNVIWLREYPKHPFPNSATLITRFTSAWAMLLMTFIMSGPHATLRQATGIPAAHMYDFITRIYPTFGGGRNYISTPAIVKRWFGSDKRGPNVKAYGTSYRSVNNTAQPASRGTSSGIGFTSQWGTRGQGRRLGGD